MDPTLLACAVTLTALAIFVAVRMLASRKGRRGELASLPTRVVNPRIFQNLKSVRFWQLKVDAAAKACTWAQQTAGRRFATDKAVPVPIAGCGISPSPAISLEVSMIITRLPTSSASTRAISLNFVVLPTPGGPRKRMDLPDSTRSLIMSIVPVMARPTRQVKPIILPWRFLMQEILCRVRSIPARLSPVN